MGRKSKIPDRWLDYRPYGEVIHHARIIPFKAPLQPDRFYDPQLFQYRWTTRELLERLPNVGLVIDLTNKFPAYYDVEDLIRNGVHYKKIACIGHNVPNENCYLEFCDVVNRFVMDNHMNNRIIGVHCTHGVNRTGYMISRFLVEKFQHPPAEAVDIFARCRGYPVERENYIEEVHKLASDIDPYALPLY